MIDIRVGDCRNVIKELPNNYFHTCVTSPPYWGLRDYGNDSQLGLEKTPKEFVNNLVKVFREVKRVLRDDGTVWLNLGDSYASSGKVGKKDKQKYKGFSRIEHLHCGAVQGLPPKNLIGIPFASRFCSTRGWVVSTTRYYLA